MMNLRPEVNACLRERVANKSANGAVFPSIKEHWEWLAGKVGFLNDPKGALAREIKLPGTVGAVHRGVLLEDAEAESLRSKLENLLFGHSTVLAGVGGDARDGALLACPDPANPNCWY